MQTCLCRRRHLMLGAATAGLACTAGPAAAQKRPSPSPAANRHAALHAALRAADAFDPYLSDGLGEIVGALGRAMRLRGGATVNAAPPGEDGIMVCVLRAERERRAPIAPALPPGIEPPPSGLAASPVADPAARVVWVDADFLRSLAVRISLRSSASWGGGGLGGVAAVAQSMLAPPPARPDLWQPATSPALRHQTLVLVSRGAGGFVLAHEMAHVLLGPPPALEPALRGLPRRARQLAPMCPALTDPAVAARRDYEDRADALALQAVLAAGDAVGRGPAGLPGELGIATLLTLLLGADIVRVGSTVDSPLPRRMLELQVGPDVAARLREQAVPRPGTDLVGLFYSDTHPAAVQRLVGVMRTLAQRPGSLWYGDPDPAASQALLLKLVEQGCAEAMREAPGR